MMNILPCIHSLNWGKTAENVMRSTMAQEVICIFHSLLMKQRLLGAFLQLFSYEASVVVTPDAKAQKEEFRKKCQALSRIPRYSLWIILCDVFLQEFLLSFFFRFLNLIKFHF